MVVVTVMSLRSPARYFRKLLLRLGHDRLVPSQVKVAAVSVDGDPITARDRFARELRAVGSNIDRHIAASDDAGLAHLARDQRGMRGAGADGRHDARGD